MKKLIKSLKLIGKVSTVVIIALLLFAVNYYHYLDNEIKEYNQNAELYELTAKDYFGVEIPENVTVVFVSDLKSPNFSIFDFISDDGLITGGTYDDNIKKIRIIDRYDISTKKNFLIHEIAHYNYRNTLEPSEIESIKDKYERACYNPREFYAYAMNDYGYFEVD